MVAGSDALWFKTAVFYELYVRSFYDSNADGYGDFRGLTEKLDYLEWLGIDCIWLLPFYQSPLRDGGYDISDFYSILPEYGNLNDFRVFLEVARARNKGSRRHGHEPHLGSASLVPRCSPTGLSQARLVRVVGERQQVRRRARHLRRCGEVQLDVG